MSAVSQVLFKRYKEPSCKTAQAAHQLASEELSFLRSFSPTDGKAFTSQSHDHREKARLLRPVSITLAVEASSRRILGFAVSQMPAKGRLTKIALKKYGPRKDERYKGRSELFEQLLSIVSPRSVIKSDENPHYPGTVNKYFPQAHHQAFKGQRGSIVGQGELKKVRFDPLFSLNHTCAMFRANVNRLFRRTWCTTKKLERLKMHLAIYAVYHNESLG